MQRTILERNNKLLIRLIHVVPWNTVNCVTDSSTLKPDYRWWNLPSPFDVDRDLAEFGDILNEFL